MSQREEISDFLARYSPFDQLPEEVQKRIAADCSLKRFKAKRRIFLEAEEATKGYYVVDGRVSMRKTSASGRELIVALLFDGEPFGIVAVLDGVPFPLTAQAQSDCTVLEIPGAVLRELFSAEPRLHRALLEVVGKRLRDSHELSRAMAHDRADVRVAAALSMLARPEESAEIKISRQEVSDLSGVTLETAVRLISAWADDGILELKSGRRIEIKDRKRLVALTLG